MDVIIRVYYINALACEVRQVVYGSYGLVDLLTTIRHKYPTAIRMTVDIAFPTLTERLHHEDETR